MADYASPWSVPRAWTILAPEGRWLGSVEMPPGFTPIQLREDRILGVERDDLGVERVVLRELLR